MSSLATMPLAIIPHETITLRAAEPRDCEAVWRWNFAPDVRARSQHDQAVALVEHTRWYQRRIASWREPIWVIEESFVPVGVARLDAAASGLARISIALAGAARGRGIGKAAISAACRAWGQPIFAEIFANNLPSRACFEACGFHSVVSCDDLLTYHWDPET